MRIAYLLTQDKGGPVDVTIRLAGALASRGTEVRVFGPVPARGADTIADRFEQITVPSKGDIRAARGARAALCAWRPDIVHAQDRRAGLVTAGLHVLPRGPRAVVHTYHGVPDDVTEPWFQGVSNSEQPSRYTKTVLAADALVARWVTKTVVPARPMGEFLKSRLRVPGHRVVHIDNCVDLPEPNPTAGPVRNLVFVGLLVPRKGLLELLAALGRPGVFPRDATLTVVGDGPERATAEAEARKLGTRVRFLGFRQDVAALLTEADALVLPSSMEQQPLAVAEAMAAGKPVVATSTGGVPDMLTVPGAKTYLAAPGDIDGLAHQLKSLFREIDPGSTGHALVTAAKARFSPTVCARRHLALYRKLLY